MEGTEFTSVTAAVEHGDERDVLVATRRKVAAAVDDETTPARDLASLTRRLLEITRAIAALDEGAQSEATAAPDEPFDAEAV